MFANAPCYYLWVICVVLQRMGTHLRFFTILLKGSNFCDLPFASSWKTEEALSKARIYFLKKELADLVSRSLIEKGETWGTYMFYSWNWFLLLSICNFFDASVCIPKDRTQLEIFLFCFPNLQDLLTCASHIVKIYPRTTNVMFFCQVTSRRSTHFDVMLITITSLDVITFTMVRIWGVTLISRTASKS